MNLPPIILASASPRRAELMRQFGIPFDIIPAKIDEISHEEMTVSELAQVNAYRKARWIAKQHPDALIIGMDTLVALGIRVFGKPVDKTEAERMLMSLQGKTHQVVTGVCLIHLRSHRQRVFGDMTDVVFRSLTRRDIQHYLSKVNPLDKAGAYAIQEHGDDIIRNIHGSFSNVVGLPIERLRVALEAFENAGMATA